MRLRLPATLLGALLLVGCAPLLHGEALGSVPAGGVLQRPPLAASHAELRDSEQDRTDRTVDVYYPTPDDTSEANRSFPLISFAHGYSGGGAVTNIAYGELLKGLAGFGYVVVSTRACDDGCSCKEHCSLGGDPKGFSTFYTQQLRAITWARAQAAEARTPEPFAELDVAAGAGIAGHSMGGQATLFSASGSNASSFDIRAAVMMHAYTHVFPAPEVPFLAFTGTKDTTAPPSMASGFYNAPGAATVKGLANREGATHHEPDVTDYNPLLPQFTAAWFKLHLEHKRSEHGIDFHALIYGNSSKSLCGGGAGKMAACALAGGGAEEEAGRQEMQHRRLQSSMSGSRRRSSSYSSSSYSSSSSSRRSSHSSYSSYSSSRRRSSSYSHSSYSSYGAGYGSERGHGRRNNDAKTLVFIVLGLVFLGGCLGVLSCFLSCLGVGGRDKSQSRYS